MNYSVIIPSRNAYNLGRCYDAVRKSGCQARVIVVDDGLPAGCGFGNVTLPGVKPFVFARNCNIGIAAAGADDVVLLNDDALLVTPGGFDVLSEAAREHPEYGVISASANLATIDQMPRGKELREVAPIHGHSAPVVAFVCAYITRRAIEAVGLLDNRFTAYGWEDNDYCRRVHHAGLKIGVHDGCYVDHGSLTSTFRGNPKLSGDIAAGKRIYLDKWGWL